jgi:hypothetical protein
MLLEFAKGAIDLEIDYDTRRQTGVMDEELKKRK